MAKQKLKPGRWLYAVGILLIIVGIAVAGALAAGGAVTALKNAQKVQVPGKSTVELDQTGAYSITFTADASGKPVTSYSAYSGLDFTLTGSDGSQVKITKVGNAAHTFTIAQAGSYTLDAEYAGGSGASATAALMSAAGIHGTAIRAVFWVMLVAGVIVLVATAVLRRRDSRRPLDQSARPDTKEE